MPCKTEKMASRLVDIVTRRLLSIEEAFGRLDASQLATLLLPLVEDELRIEGGKKYGDIMVKIMHPFLPMILTRVISNLQIEIADVLDLRSVVLQGFMRDKVVLVELFQKVKIHREALVTDCSQIRDVVAGATPQELAYNG